MRTAVVARSALPFYLGHLLTVDALLLFDTYPGSSASSLIWLCQQRGVSFSLIRIINKQMQEAAPSIYATASRILQLAVKSLAHLHVNSVSDLKK